MSTQVASKIRRSSSLIVLAKDHVVARQPYDYNALLLTRNSKSSFMPDSSVFPGGVCDAADSSPAWEQHFRRYDVVADKFDKFGNATSAPRPLLFEGETSPLSLRLTAIRETFEEMGILLCRDRKSLTSLGDFAKFYEQFDRPHWQHVVHNDANKFLELCQFLGVLPDIWSLHEWSAWRTPSTFKKRFETAFFLTALDTKPNLNIEPNEVKDCAWRSPLDYVKLALDKQIWLPPPQFYELSRCLNFKSLTSLYDFAKQRSDKGLILFHPVMFKCLDGSVHLLPGDDVYPSDPDACPDKIETGLSMKDFRALATKNLHRSEHKNQHQSELLINFNPADGQVNPLDATTL
ncbi:acyl-coenzyme A diphosphatase NUDT19 [Drosophila willistoni]|uniref:acyl-coenzyme A diphosphatase NUDT19 n=1 Tax=Drosophila willistoni TaxID=7260 RepID=UPI00017D7659|nr:acyl-coenzyme A diphosphatase NUDT19 [Drosophila willistoni]